MIFRLEGDLMPNKFDFPKGEGLDHYFRVYVPSTRSGDIPIKESAFQRRIKETKNFLLKRFDGSSMHTQVGSYRMEESGKVINERVAVITIFTDRDNYYKYDQDIRWFVMKKKHSWGQESMGYEYNGKLFFV